MQAAEVSSPKHIISSPSRNITPQNTPPPCPKDLQNFLAYTLLAGKSLREKPLYTAEAQVFTLDERRTRCWSEASLQPVPIHLYHDPLRKAYRIISVEGSKPVLNATVSESVVLNKASSKFLQWIDSTNSTVYGLGFSNEQDQDKFVQKITDIQNLCMKASMHQPALSQPSNDLISNCANTSNTIQILKLENERLKIALTQSSSNAKKWEQELASLKDVNYRLTEALCSVRNSPRKRPGVCVTEIEKVIADLKVAVCNFSEKMSQSSQSPEEDATELLQRLEKLVEELQNEVLRLDKESKDWRSNVASIHNQISKKLRELLLLHEQLGRHTDP